MSRFRLKPATVEALQWQPGVNDAECGVRKSFTFDVDPVPRAWLSRPGGGSEVWRSDWILTGTDGLRYRLTDALFRLLFEAADGA